MGPVNAIPDMVSHLCPRVMFNRDMVFAMEPEKVGYTSLVELVIVHCTIAPLTSVSNVAPSHSE